MTLKKIRIFDGAKCTGKSYRINKLREEELKKNRTVKVKHFGLFDEHTLDNYLRLITEANYDGTDVLIIDRYYMGEFVYPHVYDRDANFNIKEFFESKLWQTMSQLNETLEEGCKTIVLFDTDFEVNKLISRWKERESKGNFALEGNFSQERIDELKRSNQMFYTISHLLKDVDPTMFDLIEI